MAKIIGDYPNKASDWANGEELNGTKMNEIDRALYLLDQNALNSRDYENTKDRIKWWAVNQKNLYKGETLTAGSDCSQSTDTTNTGIYNSSSRITVTTTLGDVFIKGYINKSPNHNLQYFQSGDTVDTSKDRVIFTCYVSDASKIKTNSFYLWIGTSGGGFYKPLAPVNGWNTFTIKLNEFTNSGGAVWSAVTYYEFQWRTPVGVNAQNSYISFQYVGLIRGSTTTTYNLTNQNNGEAVYSPELVENVPIVSIYEDFLSEPVIYSLKYSTSNWMYITKTKWRTFYLKSKLVCKLAGALGGFRWQYDSNNYITVYIQSNTLYMRLWASGSEVLTESNSNVLPFSILKDDVVEFRFRKVNGYFECGITCNGSMEEFVQCGYSAWANYEGDLIWGSYTTITDYTGIYEWEVSNKNTTQENKVLKLRNDYIKLHRTTDQVINTTSDTTVQWNSQYLKGGNRLSFDSVNYSINVMKGVKTIEVNACLWVEIPIASGAYSWMTIRRNSDVMASNIYPPVSTQTWKSQTLSTIIDVVEGDKIYVVVAISVASASNLLKGNTYPSACQVTAKVLEYN